MFSTALVNPFIKLSSDCSNPCSSFSRKSCPWKIIPACVCLCVVYCIFLCKTVKSCLCALWTSGLFKGRCERPIVCQSADCWGCAGLAVAGGVWGRGRCRLGDGEWSVIVGHGSDPPGAAPQPACRRCQNDLRNTEDASVSIWQTTFVVH